MPLVSIIVPIYNVERYIKECLDSIINQTLKDIEVWLVYALMAAFINYVKKGRVIYEKNNLYR